MAAVIEAGRLDGTARVDRSRLSAGRLFTRLLVIAATVVGAAVVPASIASASEPTVSFTSIVGMGSAETAGSVTVRVDNSNGPDLSVSVRFHCFGPDLSKDRAQGSAGGGSTGYTAPGYRVSSATFTFTQGPAGSPGCTDSYWGTGVVVDRIFVTDNSVYTGSSSTDPSTWEPGAPGILADSFFSYPGVYSREIKGGSQPAEDAHCPCGADPVSTSTGEYWSIATDLAIPGRGPGLTYSRAYSSQNPGGTNGRLGYGWTDNYAMTLTTDPMAGSAALGSATVVDVTEENGSSLAFVHNSNGFYSAPSRVLATLTQHSDGTFTFTRRAREVFTFDATGRLTQISDLDGDATTLSYDTGGNLTTVTDAAGRTLTFTYTGARVHTVTDPAGRTITYTYDGSGNLQTVTDPAGAVTQYGYNSAHDLTTDTDPRGHVLTNVYNSLGQVTSQTDRRNNTTTFGYGWDSSTSESTTTVTDPRSTQTVEEFANHLLTNVTSDAGTSSAVTWNYSHDPATEAVSAVTDPLNHTSTFGYDTAGNQTSACDALNHCTSATYNSLDEPLTLTDATNITTTNTYDSAGNLLTTSTPDTQTSQTATTTYHHDDTSHPADVTSVTDPRGKTTTYTYDTYGQLTSSTDPAGDDTTYTFTCSPSGAGCRSNIGWVYTTVSPRGNVTGANPAQFTTSYTRDDDGRTLTVTDPLGHTTTTSYDPDGNIATVQDANSHTTSYTYNNNNQLITTTRPDTSTLQSSYDAAGNLTSQTDGANHTTTYSYDPLNHLSSSTDPDNRTTSYGYDAAGNPTSVTQPGGDCTATPATGCTSYGYDDANRLTTIGYSDGTTPNVSYGYDADNRRTAMTDGTGSSSYSYDSLGRLISATDGAGHVVGYSYDLDGDLTSLTYPNSNTVTRGYDDADRLTSVTDWNTNTTSFGYDPDSNLTTTTYPNGVTEATTVNHADQLTAISDTLSATTLASYTYTRDPLGQLTSTTPTGATGQGNETYDHSALNQLTTYDAASNGAYGYGPADNLTSLPNGTTQAFDPANQLTSITSAAGTSTLGYDNRGNRTSLTTPATPSQTTTYGYDQANRLTTITTTGTGSIASYSYSYDGDGLRTAKTTSTGSASYSWDHSDTLPLLLADGTTNYLYGPGGLPIEQIDSANTPTYIQHDQQGSTRLLTDTTGIVVGTYTYDPYGNTISHTGTAITALQYGGQYQDSETGLYYLRARYYDPTTTQFLTRDPLEALTGQPYQYSNDDPLDFTDPTGLCGWTDPFDCNPLGRITNAASKVGGAVTSVAKTVARIGVSTVAVVPYAFYYVTYRTQGSLGCHAPGWVNDGTTWFENRMLDIDQALDGVKRKLGAQEPNNDEGGNGGILPIHIPGIDKNPGDPLHTYLPGVDPDGSREVGPNNYGWGAGWGDRSGVPNI